MLPDCKATMFKFRVSEDVYPCLGCQHIYLFLSVCTVPEPPMLGSLTLSGDKTSVTFNCEPGYSINGQGSLLCLEDGGGWSGEVPTCCEFT